MTGRKWIVLLLAVLISGCSGTRIMRHTASKAFGSLSQALYQQRDPDIARNGSASFLLFIDALIHQNPDDERLLFLGLQAYTAYTTAFLMDSDPERAFTDFQAAMDYGFRLFKTQYHFSGAKTAPLDRWERLLASCSADDVPNLFWLANAWSGWIIAHPDKLSGLADLPVVVRIMETVLKLDETYQNGSVHLFFGLYHAIRPPAMGGDLDRSLTHFQKAIQMAGPDALMPKVLFARYYARAMFDRELYEITLRAVTSAPDPVNPELNLLNAMARQQARTLLESIDDYF